MGVENSALVCRIAIPLSYELCRPQNCAEARLFLSFNSWKASSALKSRHWWDSLNHRVSHYATLARWTLSPASFYYTTGLTNVRRPLICFHPEIFLLFCKLVDLVGETMADVYSQSRRYLYPRRLYKEFVKVGSDTFVFCCYSVLLTFGPDKVYACADDYESRLSRIFFGSRYLMFCIYVYKKIFWQCNN